MPFHLAPIDPKWAERQFPRVFQVYGATALKKQIAAFNAVVSADQICLDDEALVAVRMANNGMANTPTAILNSLSAAHFLKPGPDTTAQCLGHLNLLEESLERVLAAGIAPKTYRDMIMNPRSFFALVAEADVAATLVCRGGSLSAHTRTRADSNNNYDLHWTKDSNILRGEVKRYEDWFLKEEGINMLKAHLALAKPDFEYLMTIVKLARIPEHQRAAIDAVTETLELYCHALSQRNTPNIRTERTFEDAIAYRNPADNKFVEKVVVRLKTKTSPGRGSVQVLQPTREPEADLPVVRARLLDAARQLPTGARPNEATCIFITSHDPFDADVVKRALFGHPDATARLPGYFSHDRAEHDLDHVSGVLFFTINYRTDMAHPSNARVDRTAQLLIRTGLEKLRQDLLEEICDALKVGSSIPLRLK